MVLKYNFNINMQLSEELCEFVGVIIGDGFTNKYGHERTAQTQITGDKNLDSYYYYNTLKPICQNLFGISPRISEKDKTIRLNIYSILLFRMLTQRFGIPAGAKAHYVKIPDEILIADKVFLNATLRGMFNADGGVGFDRRKIYKTPYVRVNYTSVSLNLIRQLKDILDSYSIKHSIHSKRAGYKKQNIAFQIQINGLNNVKKFISEIGFSNPRSLDKVKYLLN